MNSDNLGGLALMGIFGQSSGSVPFKTAIIVRREATKADVGQTALAIILIHLLPKTRRTRPLCGDDGLRILPGLFKDASPELASFVARGSTMPGVKAVNRLDTD